MKTTLKTRSRDLSATKTELQGVLGKIEGPIHKNRKDPRAKALKQLGWTAGSNSKKLRVQNVKTGAVLELYLN